MDAKTGFVKDISIEAKQAQRRMGFASTYLQDLFFSDYTFEIWQIFQNFQKKRSITRVFSKILFEKSEMVDEVNISIQETSYFAKKADAAFNLMSFKAVAFMS